MNGNRIHKKFMQDKPEDARVEPPEDAAPEDTEKKRSEVSRIVSKPSIVLES